MPQQANDQLHTNSILILNFFKHVLLFEFTTSHLPILQFPRATAFTHSTSSTHRVHTWTRPCWLCSPPAVIQPLVASQGKDTGQQIAIATLWLTSSQSQRLPPAAVFEGFALYSFKSLKRSCWERQAPCYTYFHLGVDCESLLLLLHNSPLLQGKKICQIHQEQRHILELVTALGLPAALSRFGGMPLWGIHLWTCTFLQQVQLKNPVSPSSTWVEQCRRFF